MRLRICILFIFLVSNSYAQTFTDVASLQQIFESYSAIPDFGGGVSFFDFDNDGWDDLTFVRSNDSVRFYRNLNGTYQLMSLPVFVPGNVKQALWVDYDNDGDNDLCVSVDNGPCKLYKNMGNTNLVDVTVASGLPFQSGANYSIAFGDYNKDSFLDLMIGRYSYSSDSTNMLEKNALFKNNGNGTFSDVTVSSGIDIGLTQTFEAVWIDYNKDGWPDIYTATDRYDYDNALFKNNGDGTFTDVASLKGAAAVNVNAMTNTVGDFDNDADIDIYLTNIGYSDTCKLLVNDGNGFFSENAVALGLGNTQYTWGASWIDADNDSYLDLMVACDTGNSNPRTYLYMSIAGQSFVDSPQNFQSNSIANSRSIANGDFNNDGKTDVVIGNTTGYNSFLWQNTSLINNYIKITLHGTQSNRMAIGSWIYVYAGGKMFSHYTMCGENFLGQNSQHHIFGLAQYTLVDSVVVHYLSGVTDFYYNLNVNQSYDFYESGAALNYITHGDLSVCNGDTVVLDAGVFASYLWSTGATTRYLQVVQSGLYSVITTDSLGSTFNSDSAEVFIALQPQISITATDLSCFNSQDGSISLQITNQTNAYQISWNQGLQGTNLQFLYPGNYVYQYTDTFGCELTDSIVVNAPYPINLQHQIINYSSTCYGEIICMINGGTPPYTIFINGVTGTCLEDSLLPGTYNYHIVDANGCIYNESLIVQDLTITGIDRIISTSHVILNNPSFDHQLIIEPHTNIVRITMVDALGNNVSIINDYSKVSIDPSFNGVGFIIIEDGISRECFPVLILN